MAEALTQIMMDIFYVMFGFPEHTGELLQAMFGGFFGFFEALGNIFSIIGEIFG